MTDAQFLNAVALGQITPGPVVHTVAVVGYAAAGLGGGLLAALVAFAPSFAFILARRATASTACAPTTSARAFLDGAGPAAIGAILGSAVPLALALTETWQYAVLAAAAVVLLLALRRGVVLTLIGAGAAGAVAARWARPSPAEPALSATSSPCQAQSLGMNRRGALTMRVRALLGAGAKAGKCGTSARRRCSSSSGQCGLGRRRASKLRRRCCRAAPPGDGRYQLRGG